MSKYHAVSNRKWDTENEIIERNDTYLTTYFSPLCDNKFLDRVLVRNIIKIKVLLVGELYQLLGNH
jgi:hypothetical protein